MSAGASLAALLDGPARRLGDRPAVLHGVTPVRTWAGLAEAVARRAGALVAAGVAPGDRVAIVATNRPEYLEWLYAVWHAGAVAVPVAARLHAREAALLVEDSAAVLTIASPDLAGPLAAQLPGDVRLLVIGEPDERATATSDAVDAVHRGPGDDAWLFYTSGTTGRSKGARLTHANLLAVAAAYFADVDTPGPRDSLVHVAGLSHASGLFSIPFLARGATQVVPESGGFDAAELVGLVEVGERSTFFVPPVVLRRLCRFDGLSGKAVDRIGTVLCGAAPVLAGDLRTAVATFGPRIWNGYGQGESPNTITAMTTADVAAALDRPDRLTSVGTARFATRVRVVDADDREVPAGEIGEVVVDGPTVMAGYRDLPDETATTLRGGWLHTGDLGHMDADGYLHLVDRAKDVIITGGYNVYPREVEDVLAHEAGVAEVAVVGVPDEEWGERITAFVVPSGPAAVDAALLDALCRDTIARFKRPREYVLVDELPRNPAGKVLKTVLREGIPHVTEVQLLDETIRDGQQALWGMRMQAGMALPVADLLDRTGFRVIDYAGSSMFEVLVKYCREDPWQALDLLRAAIRRTPMRGGMRANAAVSFGLTPDALMDVWMRRLNEHGCRSFWIYDCLFGWQKMARLAKIAKEYGSEVAGTVFFSLSPVHTDEYFAARAAEMAAVDEIDTILLYDTAGILEPTRMRTLVPALQAVSRGKPLEFHANNLMGISGLAYVEAAKLGVQVLHTASRPMANGASVPSTESVVRNLDLLGFTHSIDTSLLPPVAEHFRAVGKAAGYLVDQVSEYDLFSTTHQIPGGMTGTLRNQLAQHNMTERMDEVLTEVARVRRELGYPIMATPFSQLVGTQAVLNVVTGKRYSIVPDEVISYAAGHYGEPPAKVDEAVLDMIMSAPRAELVAAHPPEQPTAEELHAEHGTRGDDDELFLRALLPGPAVDAMRAAGPVRRDYPLVSSEVAQIRSLLAATSSPYLRLRTETMDLQLRRG